MAVRIHPTAIIEDNVALGEGTSVWDHAHIRHGASLGEDCIVGGKATIAYDVSIGSRVKINSQAYICNAVTIEDGVMISAAVVFTNDRFPRAATSDLKQLRASTPDEHTLRTRVCAGATIGAAAVIGNDLTIGRFAMVGMAAVVTRSVPDFHLVIGNPARSIGCVCRCGEPLLKWSDVPAETDAAEIDAAETDTAENDAAETDGQQAEGHVVSCRACGLAFQIVGRSVSEVVDELEAQTCR